MVLLEGREGDVMEWTRFGVFAGGALTFVRELLRGEGIVHREKPLPHRYGEVCSEIEVAPAEQDRVLALLTAAQADAELAAQRETAALTAEESRAAAAAAVAAQDAVRASAVEARRAARRAANEARRQRRRQPWLALRRASTLPHELQESPSIALRLFGGALAVLIVAFTLIAVIGERWGTHAPAPGHHGETIPCNDKYDVICVGR